MSSRLLQGYVLAASVELTGENPLSAQRLVYQGAKQGTRWEEYRFRSSTPLRGEMQTEIGGWEYLVLCRRSGSRLLLLSEAAAIVESIMQAERLQGSLHLRRVNLGVDRLVRSLSASPTEYLLSRVDARVSGHGTSLRSMTFYGEDIGEARMFRGLLPHIECYACGLRYASGGVEICRLVNTGAISFRYSGASSLGPVERAVSFVSRNGYLGEAQS